MPQPSFSVVTPSFNQARYLRKNIESVLGQAYPLVEHIVIDNASTDGTAELLEEYAAVTWISESDTGQSDALNKALALVSNEWIIWVNSDDFLLPGALHRLADAIARCAHCSAFISNHVRVDRHGMFIGQIAPNYSPWKLRHWWWSALQVWQPGAVFKKEVFDYVGPFDTTLHYAMDFDFMLRAQDRYPFTVLDANLVAFRLHDQQKGHASEMPFIRERIKSTRRYWKERSFGHYLFYSFILFFAEGSLEFVQGLRRYEAGEHRSGKQMIKHGLLRNPLGLLRPEHIGFWIRKLIGRDAYYRMR